jgi:hypothetical protein
MKGFVGGKSLVTGKLATGAKLRAGNSVRGSIAGTARIFGIAAGGLTAKGDA